MNSVTLQQTMSTADDVPATPSKQPSALNKILTAIVYGQDSPKEGLIRAFREKHSDADSTASSLSSATSGFYGSEPQTRVVTSSSINSPTPPKTPEAAAASTACQTHHSTTTTSSSRLIRPAAVTIPAAPDIDALCAYRMLTVAPSLPQSMQRAQWTSYDYHIMEKLYTGYASKVYKAICRRSNEVVVLKSYQLSAICELYQHQIFREVGLHASLEHENVVKLNAAFQEGDFVVLVQEYAAGGNLFDLLQRYGGRLSEHVTVQMVLEPFLRVLQYLHTRGIIHRDIKPENILFDKDMTLKLADFGLAIDLRRERAVTRAGTLDYMAPEVLNCPYKNKPEENKEKSHLHYSGSVDSWAVGVLAYELLVGCPPFHDSSRDRVEQRIRSSSPTFPRSMSENARSFITAALTKDPAKRSSVMQLLNHPWINMYRARRSMRQVAPTSTSSSSAGGDITAAADAAPAAATLTAAATAPIPAAAAAAAASPPSPAAAAPTTPTPKTPTSKPSTGLLQHESSYVASLKHLKAAAATFGSTAAAAAAAASSSRTCKLQQLQERKKRIEEVRAAAAAESRAAAQAAAASRAAVVQGYSKASLAAKTKCQVNPRVASGTSSVTSPRIASGTSGVTSSVISSPRTPGVTSSITPSPRTALTSPRIATAAASRTAAAVAAAAASVASLPPSPYKPAGTLLKTPRAGYSTSAKPYTRSAAAAAAATKVPAAAADLTGSSSSRLVGSAKSSSMLVTNPRDLQLPDAYAVSSEAVQQRRKWAGALKEPIGKQ